MCNHNASSQCPYGSFSLKILSTAISVREISYNHKGHSRNTPVFMHSAVQGYIYGSGEVENITQVPISFLKYTPRQAPMLSLLLLVFFRMHIV